MKFIYPIILFTLGILGLGFGILAKITSHPMGNDLITYSSIVILVAISGLLIKVLFFKEDNSDDQ